MNVEKLPRDVWAHHVETKSCICHICGFEKSGNFEESCICGSVPAVDNSVGIKRPASSFRAGGHPAKRSCFIENGMKKTEAKFESHLSNSDKVKAMGQAPDLEPREGNAGKPPEGAGHTRRLNDTPAVVPIKKRRIQIMKSPSPPPRSPSPQTPLSRSSSPRGVSPARSPASGRTPSSAASISPLLGYSSVSSPRSAEPVSMSSSKARALLQPALHLQPLACSGGEVGGATASSFDITQALDTKALSMSSTAGDVDVSFGVENEQRPSTLVDESCNKNYGITGPNDSCGGLEEPIGHHLQNDPNGSTDKQEGELQRSESSSFSRDDRLHWDLNTDMAAWDASTEQVSDKGIDEQAAETPLRSPSANSAEARQDHGAMGCEHDPRKEGEEEPESGEEEAEPEKQEPDTQRGAVEEQPNIREAVSEEEPEIGEETEEDPGMGEETVEEEPEVIMEELTPAVFEHTKGDSPEKEQVGPLSGQVESAWNEQDAADLPESAKPDAIDLPEYGKPRPSDTDLSSDGGNAAEPSENQCHEDDIPVKHFPKSGKQAKSMSDDAEGWNYASEEPEFEEHLDYGDSDFRDPDDVGLDVDDRTSLMQEESNWKVEDGAYHGGSFRRTSQECDTSSADAAVAKASSCDGQPLERSPERHTLPGRSRTTGWDKLPEGFDNAEEALKAAKEVSARRGTRGGGPWSNSVGRGSSLSSHSASRFGPGPGPGPARNAVREGFSSARGDGYYGDRHPDEMMYDRDGYRHGRRPDDSFGAHNAVRGRDPVRRPGVFGRGRGGGWIDSQPGRMNQWGPSRHRPSSGFGGSSNAAAVAAARVEHSGFMVAPDGTLTKPGGGMGPGRGGLRSTVSGGRGGRGGHIQVGRGPPGDMDGGVHYPLRAGVRADRATGGMNTGGRGLGGNSGPGYGSGMHDRGGRGPIDRYRGGVMESRRSESPCRPHPLDHPNMMGRMPGMRADSRVMRSRTPPPNHRSVGHADFGPSRSQRSPPPPSRWSCDKREVDYQDREFKRPVLRPRVPSQRTSPHVIHGSSLTDDRDRQVLAGSRQSPVKGPVNSSLRNSRDDGLDARPPKRSEEEDIRHTGSFLKEGDYRRSSPMRESDRDRDRGGLYRRDRDRDREDDRRRDFRRSTSRDGRFSSGPKYTASREADDDVAPRRRRPS